MFTAAKSSVSTASKSFPDLLNFWTNKEAKQPGNECPTWLQALRNKDRRYVPLGTQFEKNKTTSTGVSHEEETTQDHNESAFYSDTGQLKEHDRTKCGSDAKLVVAEGKLQRHPGEETVSLYSFSDSNRNIEFLTNNVFTVSKESFKDSHEQIRDTDTPSIYSHSEYYSGELQERISDVSAHKNSVKPTTPKYKKKQSPRTSPNQKHAKPKSESATERQLINKSKNLASKKATSIEDANYMIERRGRQSSVSSISLEHEDDMGNDATSLWSGTGSATSLSVGSPSTDVCMAPQGPLSKGNYEEGVEAVSQGGNVIIIQDSSHVFITASTGPTVSSPSDRLSFASFPTRTAMSMSSGDSISHSIRNTVAELTKSTLTEHKSSKISVKTKRLKTAKRFLRKEQKQFLVLTGHQGDGLSTLGKDLLIAFPERDQYIVMEPTEVIPCIIQSGKKRVILFAEDVFGTTYFDEKRFEEWRRIMNRIFSYITCNNAILIMALHIEMIQESKCKQFYDYYQDNVINISRTDLQLDCKKMKQILRSNIDSQMNALKIEICELKQEECIPQTDKSLASPRRHIISEETIDEIAGVALPSGFPGQVAGFLNNVDNLKKGVTFFNRAEPDKYHEIENWMTNGREGDSNRFIALIAVFVYGELDFKMLEIQLQSEKDHQSYLTSCAGKGTRYREVARMRSKMPEMRCILKGFAKRFGMNQTLVESVRSGVQLLLGRYLKEISTGKYSFASVSVEKVIAIICAQTYLVDVCKFSSHAVFSDIIRPATACDDKKLNILINEKQKPACLAINKRLKDMFLSNKVLEFVGHPVMRIPWFAMQFIKYMKLHKDWLMQFVSVKDNKSKLNALEISLDHPYNLPIKTHSQCLTEDILLRKAWLKLVQETPEEAIRYESKFVEKCCEMRWEHSYFRLTNPKRLNSYFRLTNRLPVPITKACLKKAISGTSSSIVQDLLTHNELAFSDDEGYAALRYACDMYDDNDEDTQRIFHIIRKKIPIDYSSETEESIIHQAGRSGDTNLLAKVIKVYNNKSITNKKGQTCMHLATEGYHALFVSQALNCGVSQRKHDTRGELPIHYASTLGLLDIAEILLKHDGDIVNEKSNTGSTPLHLATQNQHLQMCILLLEWNADLFACNKARQTPAYYAASSKNGDILDYFLTVGLDAYFRTEAGEDLLAVATKAGNSEGMTALLNKLGNTQAAESLLNDCLFNIICQKEDYAEILDSKHQSIMLLIEKGANMNCVNEEGSPLLQTALESKCALEIIELLIKKGACVRTRNSTGDTALHVAVKEDNKEAAELILENDQRDDLLNIRNNKSELPLHIAAALGKAELVSLLKSESNQNSFFVKDGKCFTALQIAQYHLKTEIDYGQRQKYLEAIQVL